MRSSADCLASAGGLIGAKSTISTADHRWTARSFTAVQHNVLSQTGHMAIGVLA